MTLIRSTASPACSTRAADDNGNSTDARAVESMIHTRTIRGVRAQVRVQHPTSNIQHRA
jgi:hypothetical protein